MGVILLEFANNLIREKDLIFSSFIDYSHQIFTNETIS